MLEFFRENNFFLVLFLVLAHLIVIIITWPRPLPKGNAFALLIFASCFHPAISLLFSVVILEVFK